MLRRAATATVLACAVWAPAAAAQAPAPPADRLAAAVEQVGGATAARFDAMDQHGASLDGLKVVQAGGSNVGVYHGRSGGRFELYAATSEDLLTWTRRGRLDVDASQGTIAALPGGGFLVAYEWANLLDVLPRGTYQPQSLPAPLSAVTPLQQLVVTVDRVRIRFRYYASLERLLAGRHSRQFTAPRQLSSSAQGTPSFGAIALSPGLSRSRIEVGLHYRADTDGDGFPDDDRQGTAVLTNFASWASRTAPELDARFLRTGDLHAPYTAPPRANIGDRDEIVLEGARLALHEAQYVRGDFGSWRTFLLDRDGGSLRALRPVTPGGSTAFANPTVTELTLPGGARGVLVTAFVFAEGASPGEAGQLVYYREL